MTPRASILCLVVFVAVLVAVAPRELGGSKTYVSTFGTSMEPTILAGDLIIAQSSVEYAVGDTVAYPSSTLGGVTVLHRIVDQVPEGFVTKGDNNSWLDPDHPVAADIYGKQWIHIPQGGVWLKRLASPAIVGGIAFFILWWSTSVHALHRPRRRRRQTMGVAPHKPRAVR